MRNQGVSYPGNSPGEWDAFRAVADPTRRAVLDMLRTGRKPVNAIAREFPISRPAVSKHLRILCDANLLVEKREGRQHFFELNPGPLRTVDDWLNSYRQFWTVNLQNLKTFVEAKHKKK